VKCRLQAMSTALSRGLVATVRTWNLPVTGLTAL
jgi:hypothetical protein